MKPLHKCCIRWNGRIFYCTAWKYKTQHVLLNVFLKSSQQHCMFFFFLLICIFILHFAASFLLSHYRDSIRSGLIYTQADIRYSVHFSINRSEHKMFQLVLTGKVNHFQNFYHSGEAPHMTWNNQWGCDCWGLLQNWSQVSLVVSLHCTVWLWLIKQANNLFVIYFVLIWTNYCIYSLSCSNCW